MANSYFEQLMKAQEIMEETLKRQDMVAKSMGLIRCQVCSIQDSWVYHAPPECCLKDKKVRQ